MTASVEACIQAHCVRYPKLEIQDAIKFLYQSYMGGGHLIQDEAHAQARLEEEWTKTPASRSVPLWEPLGEHFCRLHFSACKVHGLSSKTVYRLFLLTAQETTPDPSALDQSLALLDRLPFPNEEIERTRSQYRASGCPMVGHSAAYRNAYSPAYRIIAQRYLPLLPILAAIDQEMSRTDAVRVAIDGPCASGKTTLGQTLADLYGCPLLHMDDFFLRPEQRTAARLAEPGGNVDYQRFDREVLTPLCLGTPACYRPWHCRSGSFGPSRTVPPSPLTVVEGSYALHPSLRGRYHLRIWTEAPLPVRLQRLAQRGGPDCLSRFQTQWIPLEDRYFSACQVQDCCQLSYSPSVSE
jgi:hypothetical protein